MVGEQYALLIWRYPLKEPQQQTDPAHVEGHGEGISSAIPPAEPSVLSGCQESQAASEAVHGYDEQ